MAEYYSQSTVSPLLPLVDMSAAERLVLGAVFDAEEDEGELYLFAENGRNLTIAIDRNDARTALKATCPASAATRLLSKAVAETADGEDVVSIDVEDGWIDILQDIIRRSVTLTFLALETAHTCSKMRADGFGGGAIVVTADTVDMMSTSQFIDETLAARLNVQGVGLPSG